MQSDDSTKKLTIHGALEKVLAGEDLSRAEIVAAMEEVSSGRANAIQFGALYTALSLKGMTTDESSVVHELTTKQLHEAPPVCAAPVEASRSSSAELELITHLVTGRGDDLSRREAENAMELILSGEVHSIPIAQFLAALRFKGETVDELVGFATAMRRHATPIFPARHARGEEPLVDTAGTGGDARGTFNISTAAAFVIAGAGVRVAKHGNRAISSSCGSADVLEALGVAIDLAPERVGRAIEEVGIGFLFAPAVHAAMRHAMPVRRELKVRTVFNLLGPLTNPAGASAQIVGVYDAGLTELLARALGELGVRRAFVVHGADGLDEISISDETAIAELRDGAVQSYTVAPEDFGLARAPLEKIRGGDAGRNAQIIDRILGRHGAPHEHGPYRDIVLANSAPALVAAGRSADFLEGVRVAAESIDSGAARAKLDALIEFSRSEKPRGQTAS
ncbi:MAG TPA: anthranilate phosphoribosyltransferase [Candidatus Sulfotelmatobacter sp.]|nr:anthranilate phosphoribosyltransferase [Candidatus Sulfotelmatobacter sp.]